MSYSQKKKVVSETTQRINANPQYFSHALYFRRARQLSLGTAMQPAITICCVGSLFPLVKGTDSLAWPEKQNSVLCTH